jgi:peroxiredoxin
VHSAAETSYGQKAPAFGLPRTGKPAGEGGGVVRLSDYRGTPVVLVPFSSDLYFGPGYGCPDCFPSLVRLLQMTSSGTNPNVLAVQSGR